MYISQDELKELHKMFHECGPFFIALGEEIRQKIILDILDAGVDGLNVMTLTSMSHLSRPAISHHLKVLKDSGLVIAERRAPRFSTRYLFLTVFSMESIFSSQHWA